MSKMTSNTPHPSSSASKKAQRTSMGGRFLGVLTRGPYRKFFGSHSPSSFISKGLAVPVLALLAALAVGLLVLSPVGLLQAQDSGTIEYAENGMVEVAVFVATDPENAGDVTWSLKADVTTDDDGDFDIDKADGVLTFKKSPDYEMATGGGDEGTSNTYTVTVIATDADGQTSEKTVTIEVTNMEEPGKVTLDKMAPYPGVELTAMESDPDMVVSGSQEWQWSRSMSQNGTYTDIEDADMAAYTPNDGDVGYYLKATAEYEDQEDDGKSAMAMSAHVVQAINVPNETPVFPDQDPDTAGVQNTATTRMIGENTDAGENVGNPVVANDANNDILTYTLAGDAAAAFKIDPATGQITVDGGRY